MKNRKNKKGELKEVKSIEATKSQGGSKEEKLLEAAKLSAEKSGIPWEKLDESVAALSKEQGVPRVVLIGDFLKSREKIEELTRSKNGKCRVVCYDRFDYSEYLEGEYDTAEEALRVARKLTKEAMPDASDRSIATIYCAYDSQGYYLGGDVWKGE